MGSLLFVSSFFWHIKWKGCQNGNRARLHSYAKVEFVWLQICYVSQKMGRFLIHVLSFFSCLPITLSKQLLVNRFCDIDTEKFKLLLFECFQLFEQKSFLPFLVEEIFDYNKLMLHLIFEISFARIKIFLWTFKSHESITRYLKYFLDYILIFKGKFCTKIEKNIVNQIKIKHYIFNKSFKSCQTTSLCWKKAQ